MLMFDAVVPSMPNAGPPGSGAPSGGTTRFSVDPDQAQKMIEGLNAAIEKLRLLHDDSKQIALNGAPGPDPYSGWSTLAMREVAGEQDGGYGWANIKAREALEETVKRIEKALADYRGTDDAAKTAMGR
jgi:hypothetical protein